MKWPLKLHFKFESIKVQPIYTITFHRTYEWISVKMFVQKEFFFFVLKKNLGKIYNNTPTKY